MKARPLAVAGARRHDVQIAAAGAALSLTATASEGAAPLQWRALPAGERGFFRAPVLLSGAFLIDGGFSPPDGRVAVDAIKASGKTLTTVCISQSDPDYGNGVNEKGNFKRAMPNRLAWPGKERRPAPPLLRSGRALSCCTAALGRCR